MATLLLDLIVIVIGCFQDMSPAAVAEGQARMKKIFNEYVAFSFLISNLSAFHLCFCFFFFLVAPTLPYNLRRREVLHFLYVFIAQPPLDHMHCLDPSAKMMSFNLIHSPSKICMQLSAEMVYNSTPSYLLFLTETFL